MHSLLYLFIFQKSNYFFSAILFGLNGNPCSTAKLCHVFDRFDYRILDSFMQHTVVNA